MRPKGARSFRRRFRESLAALAFVAFFPHALIPVGFMPGVAHGHGQLVVCSGVMSTAAHLGSHGSSGSSADSPCPFAMAGDAAPLPAGLTVALSLSAPGPTVPVPEHTVVSDTPPRYAAPREPPTLD